jgi:predicted HicB family RNase H-like nuclease
MRRGVAAMEKKDPVQLTVRLPYEMHRKMKFVSLDTGESLNDMVIRGVLRVLEGVHVDVPSDLLAPAKPR